MKETKYLAQSIVWYLVLIIFLLTILIFWLWERYSILWTIGLLSLILKDVVLYGIDIQPTKIKTLKPRSEIWFLERCMILNRIVFFPCILAVYTLYFLGRQIGFNIALDFLNHTFLIIMIVLSWILRFSLEKSKKVYQQEIESISYSIIGIISSLIFSLLWAYITINQTIHLGVLWYIIGIILWIVIFLLWVILLDNTHLDQ